MALAAWAQSSQNVTLHFEVLPEVRLNISTVTLHFKIPSDADAEIPSQTVDLVALARPARGQFVHLFLRSASELRWSATKTASRAGGNEATCTSGSVVRSEPADLVSNWVRGGAVTCAVTFSPADPSKYPPGVHNATLNFDISLR